MPVHEESFRIGCGRYLQGKGYLCRCGEEIARLGTNPLIVGDGITLGVALDKIVNSLEGYCKKYEVFRHDGTCNEPDAVALAQRAKENGCDVIVGVGGGVIMDFAKLCAYFAGMPIVNVPTSSATCAAYAPLSVRYTPEGKTVGARHYETEVNAVIADTEILAAQPVRLLLAGVFDAQAKFLEITQRIGEFSADAMGLDYAYALARHSYDVLERVTRPCIEAMARGEVTADVEQTVFSAIAATGVISGIARGSNQCALAHKYYETARYLFPESSKPYLHGEIVGVGLLLQNHFNGEEERNAPLLSLMKAHGMPYNVATSGVEPSEEVFEEFYTRICHSSAVNADDAAQCAKFRDSLRYLWGI